MLGPLPDLWKYVGISLKITGSGVPLSCDLQPLSNGYRVQTLLKRCTIFDALKLSANFRDLRFSRRHPSGELGGTFKDDKVPIG